MYVIQLSLLTTLHTPAEVLLISSISEWTSVFGVPFGAKGCAKYGRTAKRDNHAINYIKNLWNKLWLVDKTEVRGWNPYMWNREELPSVRDHRQGRGEWDGQELWTVGEGIAEEWDLQQILEDA